MDQKPTFPPKGLTYYWFLNHTCEEETVDRQIAAFAEAGIGAVCLHPRDGLLLPYGGQDWFDFIRSTAKKLSDRGVQVWLYDEDPFPSGNAGGRLVREHPEFEGRVLRMHRADPAQLRDGLFGFPADGPLLWCGLVSKRTAECLEDLTDRVGMVRRQWDTMRGWDSRWYYPATPLYECDRAMTYDPEYAVRMEEIPGGAALVGFVAEPAGRESKWGALVDWLNPDATDRFIEMTHKRYDRAVGDMFGNEITVIFTDEPKFQGTFPWTPGMFEDFSRSRGYDLRPRLYHLFCETCNAEVARTRVDYREWCGRRFETAWLKRITDWCHAHDLRLVGHISPEDDPVQQAGAISNLLALHRHFDLAGLDLIIPAVGDAEHPIINVGIVSAASARQQQEKAGVMSESLACSGVEFTGPEARKIINWQTVMGLNVPVIHGAFLSMEGHRSIDAPPDFGPNTAIWPEMVDLHAELPKIQETISSGRQVAPVAILWPIRSFYLRTDFWQAEPGGLRGEFLDLLQACLEAHVGVHLLDEADLWEANVTAEGVRIGRACYSTIVLPAARIWHQNTLAALEDAACADLQVFRSGTAPEWFQRKNGEVADLDELPYAAFAPAEIVDHLPRLAEVTGPDGRNVRISAWEADDRTRLLVTCIGEGSTKVMVAEREVHLEEGDIEVLSLSGLA
jgi:hypothetical protein